MGQTTSTEVQSGQMMDQKTGTPPVTTMPQSPAISVNIKNSTNGTLYIDVDSTISGGKPLTLASGKTGIMRGVCSSCSVLVFKDIQRTQLLVSIPYKTYLNETQGKSQPLIDIGFSSKIVDVGTFIASPTTMNMNTPVSTMNSYPVMNTTTPTAFTPRPTINATLIAPTTMKK